MFAVTRQLPISLPLCPEAFQQLLKPIRLAFKH
jgi:hypothetical protein